MRMNRPFLALLVAASALTLGAVTQPAQAGDLGASRSPAQPAARPSSDPAAGRIVIDVSSPDQIPGVGSHASAVPAGVDSTRITYRTKAFTNNDGGQCLDGDRNTIPNNGAKVQLWACNGWDNQSWYWTPVAGLPSGSYTLQNGEAMQCLDGDTNTIPNNGAKVQLWACNGWTNQTWLWNGSTLRNSDRGECLDGDTNTIGNNGAKVQLWACNGWPNQSWTFH
ncbi:ricin-type beta-trefoil lectin domain protein [Kitasatospora sp. RB6PN24]|uniref:RICIN domain-containing protein n=1 Tax=Kitasatospora humi TaxID=2893891 RepID=UPI001E61BEB8|nr:RICIN domain-containing protein [Kitasatospora humi]MCC9307221.1 ricin-type beta-trefoil lectin domain protein [Kitasatospora humi]